MTRNAFLMGLGILTTSITIVTFVTGFLGDKKTFGISVLLLTISIIILLFSLKPDPKNKKNRISAKQAAASMSGLYNDDRLSAIGNIVHGLPEKLSGEDVSVLLAGLYSEDRLDAIKILNPKIRKPVTEKDYSLILSGMYSDDKSAAVAILSKER